MTALTLPTLLTTDAIALWVLIAILSGFVALMVWLDHCWTQDQDRTMRDALHRTDQIRKGETK